MSIEKQRIAIYIRLSKEDDTCREESNSITMQRIFLQKYAADHFAEYDLLEFCDDGYTGTNFKRPGMQSMLERVRNSELDCILVKDFSRFARDYIELGSYLEQVFPFLGVRFISVNDHYDSRDYRGSIGDIDVNFKNLLYDLYSKDLSGKVRSSLAVRKEQGQYVSGNAPFGYGKAAGDRHALLIEPDEAEVVRRIFDLTLEGATSVEIARLFNKTGVKTPVEFKMEKGKTSRTPKGTRFLWSSSTICQILRNEIYIGNIVQKKYTKDFVGGKNHLNPREDWLISNNHHEPIIEREVFGNVQEGRGKKRNPQVNQPHPLTGKLICGCCKKNLRYRRGLNPYFTCHERYSNGLEGCVENVNGMFLEQYILFFLQEKLRKTGEMEKLQAEMLKNQRTERQELKKRRSLLIAHIEREKQKNFANYQDYASGKSGIFTSNESAVKSAEEDLRRLEESIQEKEAAYLKGKRNSASDDNGAAVLSKEMLDRYIEKVVVYDEQNVEIQWRTGLEPGRERQAAKPDGYTFIGR